MKKTVRRLFSLIVVAAMIMAMSVVAFADGDGTTGDKAPTAYPVVIKNAEEGHTYEAYQIFAGDLAEDGTLSNITWGTGVTEAGQTALGDAAAVAANLAKKSTEEGYLAPEAFAKTISGYLAAAAKTTSTCTDGEYTISDLAPGYYLVKDKDGSLGLGVDGKENMAYTAYILEVVKEVEVTPKSDKPTVEKKVKDINDTTEGTDATTRKWQDSADYDIGDEIPYQLKATLGNIDKYTTYNVSFIDTLSKGLTYNNDAKVYVDGVDKTSSFAFTSSTDEESGYTTLTWTCTDVKAEAVGADSKSIITVEYTAKLNNDAIIGAAGNPNYVKLQYSNNPNGTGNGETPEDKVTVFTFKLVVNKVDQDGNALAGATFTLYKEIKDTKELKEIGTETGTGEDGNIFTWKGLDDGNYVIKETKTPAGYNTMADMKFTVTADHEVTSDDPLLTSLTGKKDTGEITFTADTTEGSLTVDVENKKGSILPSTGGIGTMILYVAGGALVLLGAALIVIMNVKRNRQ